MPDALVLPLLLAAANPLPLGSPLPVGSVVPLAAPAPTRAAESPVLGNLAPVETFDPAARAAVIAQSLPRSWSGSYQPFDGSAPQPVSLNLASAIAFGQIVDVRGELTVGSTVTPVQGNLNAKSDQLDLLLLCQCDVAGLERGGSFLGLQGFNLSGWVAPRLTHPGGQLVLSPSRAAAPLPPSGGPQNRQGIRGLW